jgi:uncharacterized membrane protein YtjA (UPF0391 family)
MTSKILATRSKTRLIEISGTGPDAWHPFPIYPFPDSSHKESVMLRWAVIFFVVALVAAVFGFGGIAAGAAGIAKILFFLFLVLFVVSLIAGMAGGRRAKIDL